jgi:hypothetical protein
MRESENGRMGTVDRAKSDHAISHFLGKKYLAFRAARTYIVFVVCERRPLSWRRRLAQPPLSAHKREKWTPVTIHSFQGPAKGELECSRPLREC